MRKTVTVTYKGMSRTRTIAKDRNSRMVAYGIAEVMWAEIADTPAIFDVTVKQGTETKNFQIMLQEG